MIEILIATFIILTGGVGLWYLYKHLNDKIVIEKEAIEAEEEASINEIIEQIKTIDDQMTTKVLEIQAMNTVSFECPCNNNNNIVTFIDLSKDENLFTCPECRNEYRIEISMVPILKGKIVDDHNLYNLLINKRNSKLND